MAKIKAYFDKVSEVAERLISPHKSISYTVTSHGDRPTCILIMLSAGARRFQLPFGLMELTKSSDPEEFVSFLVNRALEAVISDREDNNE